MPQLENDAFVDALNQGENNPEDTMLIFGYVGDGEAPGGREPRDDEDGQGGGGWKRAYTDKSLTAYLEFREADVVHFQKAPESVSALGGYYIWLKKDSQAVYSHRNTAIQDKAELIRGTLTDHLLSLARPVRPVNPEPVPVKGQHWGPEGTTKECCRVGFSLPQITISGPTCIPDPFIPTICGVTCLSPCTTVLCVPDLHINLGDYIDLPDLTNPRGLV